MSSRRRRSRKGHREEEEEVGGILDSLTSCIGSAAVEVALWQRKWAVCGSGAQDGVQGATQAALSGPELSQ